MFCPSSSKLLNSGIAQNDVSGRIRRTVSCVYPLAMLQAHHLCAASEIVLSWLFSRFNRPSHGVAIIASSPPGYSTSTSPIGRTSTDRRWEP